MRTDLRELVASAVAGKNLTANDLREVALDRVMALGAAGIEQLGGSGLGTSLWRLKWARDFKEYEPSLDMLTAQVALPGRPKVSHAQKRRLCQRVLDEWVCDVCETCSGRGHMVIVGTPHAKGSCLACEGTGHARPDYHARMTWMGIRADDYPKWEARFDQALQCIRAADEKVWRRVASELGRHG